MEYRIGDKVFGEWGICREIGEGANGKVFEIQKNSFGVSARSVLKVIRIPKNKSEIDMARNEGMDDLSVTSYFYGFVEEIVKEISVMTSLKGHPHIVAYEDHDVIAHEDSIGWDILIRMELLTPLTEYLRHHTMDEAEVIRLGRELSSALAYCQGKGLIHRDIKPQNVFVGDMGQFKLGDFGEARIVEKTTSGLSRKGTESYMAPEVYKNEKYGPTVDIYSLGLMLYNLSNKGRLPFYPAAPTPIKYGDREKALSRRISGEALPMPAYATTAFGQVILQACAYDPKQRYHSAAEFLEALQQVGQAVEAETEIFEDGEQTVSMWKRPEEKTTEENLTEASAVEENREESEDRTVSIWSASKPEPVKPEPKKTSATREIPAVSPPKKKSGGIGAVVALLVICAAVFAGVFLMTSKANQVQLNVINGIGGGSYKVEEQVTVTAEVPEGYVFLYWVSGIYSEYGAGLSEEDVDSYMIDTYYESAVRYLGDATQETVTFSMPNRNLQLQAVVVTQEEWELRQTLERAGDALAEGFMIDGRFYQEVTPGEYARMLEGDLYAFDINDKDVFELPADGSYENDMYAKMYVAGENTWCTISYQVLNETQRVLHFGADDPFKEEIILNTFNESIPHPMGLWIGQEMSEVLDVLGISQSMLDQLETYELSKRWMTKEADSKYAGWTVYGDPQFCVYHLTLDGVSAGDETVAVELEFTGKNSRSPRLSGMRISGWK